MIRHQSLVLAITAGLASSLLIPIEPYRVLILAVPTLWVMTWIGYCRDLILNAVNRLGKDINATEQRITEHIDIGVSDTLIAIRNNAPNQRTGAYDRSQPGLRSV